MKSRNKKLTEAASPMYFALPSGGSLPYTVSTIRSIISNTKNSKKPGRLWAGFTTLLLSSHGRSRKTKIGRASCRERV